MDSASESALCLSLSLSTGFLSDFSSTIFHFEFNLEIFLFGLCLIIRLDPNLNIFVNSRHLTLSHVYLKAYNQVHTIVSKKTFDFIQL